MSDSSQDPRESSAAPESSPQAPDPAASADRDEAVRDAAFQETGSQPAASAETADPAGDEVDALKTRLEHADREVLIAQAELENFRKRSRRESENQLRYAIVPLVQDILQVRDNLRRALQSSGSEEQGSLSGLQEGVAMVAKMLDDTLSKHGCHPIEAIGHPFDPNYHEAISQIPSDDYPSGTVAHEAVTGFVLHDRVVRPSQVVVSTGPAA